MFCVKLRITAARSSAVHGVLFICVLFLPGDTKTVNVTNLKKHSEVKSLLLEPDAARVSRCVLDSLLSSS